MSIDEEAKELAVFLGEQGHSNPVVFVYTSDHPDVEDWSSGHLEVWSKDNYLVPFYWRSIPVEHIKEDVAEHLAAGESDKEKGNE